VTVSVSLPVAPALMVSDGELIAKVMDGEPIETETAVEVSVLKLPSPR
jgi:hypothetical protein